MMMIQSFCSSQCMKGNGPMILKAMHIITHAIDMQSLGGTPLSHTLPQSGEVQEYANPLHTNISPRYLDGMLNSLMNGSSVTCMYPTLALPAATVRTATQ